MKSEPVDTGGRPTPPPQDPWSESRVTTQRLPADELVVGRRVDGGPMGWWRESRILRARARVAGT